jgi:hypothetical protein
LARYFNFLCAHHIRAFLLERGIAVRQGLRALRTAMPNVLGTNANFSPEKDPRSRALRHWRRQRPAIKV